MLAYASTVIALAREQVGYLEKRSNSQLDDKTANAGSNNYTKYARDLDAIPGFYNGRKQGYPWCDCWVDWVFVQVFGVEKAKELLCQPSKSYGAGCGYSAQYYKNKGQWHKKDPKPGDQIFFSNYAHTGLVIDVDRTYVYTIEGNTSTKAGVVANGGGVWEKKYRLNDKCIDGYGRPNYDEESASENKQPEVVTPAEEYTLEQFIRDVQNITGAAVDGEAGPETIGKTKTLSTTTNRKHELVRAVQRRLNTLGYNAGEVDGIYGNMTRAAVIAFQRDEGCIGDGIITARNKTWRKLLEME